MEKWPKKFLLFPKMWFKHVARHQLPGMDRFPPDCPYGDMEPPQLPEVPERRMDVAANAVGASSSVPKQRSNTAEAKRQSNVAEGRRPGQQVIGPIATAPIPMRPLSPRLPSPSSTLQTVSGASSALHSPQSEEEKRRKKREDLFRRDDEASLLLKDPDHLNCC